MPSNLFSSKSASTATVNSPWSSSLTLTASGQNLANLFALYNSQGAVTVGSGTTAINATQDGPIQVARYGALTVNGTLTASNRCRGLVVLCDSLSMGASGVITMNGLGAAGSSKWANQDIVIPTIQVAFSGKNTSFAAFQAYLAATGYGVFDPTLYACPPPGFGDVQANFASWPGNGTAIISKVGCGSAGSVTGMIRVAGVTGNAGSNGGPGGGGSGGGSPSNDYGIWPGANAYVWGGGPGGQGIGTLVYDRQPPNLNAGDFCNQGGSSTCSGGGGAGNPGGSGYGSGGSQGVGGVLVVICRGAVSFASGAQMTANGSAGGAGGSNGGGGGSGGGSVSLLYLSGATTGLTMTASGGSGGSGGLAGGAGGAGSTQAKTFSQMGY